MDNLRAALKNVTGGKRANKTKKGGSNLLDNLKKQEGGKGNDPVAEEQPVGEQPVGEQPAQGPQNGGEEKKESLSLIGGADEELIKSTVGAVGGKRKSRKSQKSKRGAKKSRKNRKSKSKTHK